VCVQHLRRRHANRPREGSARGLRRGRRCAAVGCRCAWLRGKQDASVLQYGPYCRRHSCNHGCEGRL